MCVRALNLIIIIIIELNYRIQIIIESNSIIIIIIIIRWVLQAALNYCYSKALFFLHLTKCNICSTNPIARKKKTYYTKCTNIWPLISWSNYVQYRFINPFLFKKYISHVNKYMTFHMTIIQVIRLCSWPQCYIVKIIAPPTTTINKNG